MIICFDIQLTADNDIDWESLPAHLDVDEQTQPTIDDDNPDLFTGSYTGETVYNVSFPNSEKNYRILGATLSGASFKMKRVEYNISAVYNGEVLAVDKMYSVRNGFNSDGRFEVQLFNSKNWVKLAAEKKINTIEVFDKIQVNHSSGNIDLFNGLGPKWDDNTIPIRFPFVMREDFKETKGLFFGIPVTTLDNYFVTESDLTPYVSLLRVLKKGFAEIGWKFECPFLESDYGRRIWVDLIKDDFPVKLGRKPFLSEGGLAFYGVKGFYARFKMFGNRNTTYSFGAEQSTTPDANNQWFLDGVFREAIVADFNLSMTLKRISPTTKVFEGEVFINIFIGGIILNSFPYYMTGGEYEYVNIELPELSINERDTLSVELELKRNQVNDNDSHYIQVTDIKLAETKLHRRYLNKTSNYLIHEMFYEDNLLELLKGFAHMIFGKISKDDNKRIVRLFTPYTVTVSEEEAEGYYKNQISKLDKVHKVEITSKDTDRKRFLHLTFQDSNEKIVKELYPDNDKYIEKYGLHGVFVDFGEGYSKEVEPYKNPYFKPTLSLYKDSVFCSAIAGYEDGTYQNKGRRILFAMGITDITFKGPAFGVYAGERELKFKFWSKTATKVSPFWAHQSINEALFTIPGDVKFMHLAFSTIKDRPDYVDVYDNLYDLLIKKYMVTYITSIEGVVDTYLTSSEYNVFDKRKQYFFNVKDALIVCQVVGIAGYRPCDNVTTPIKFIIGDNFSKDPETTSTPPTFDRPYDSDFDVEIIVEKVDCTYYITTAPSGFRIQWQYVDETTWYDYDELNGIEDPRTSFIVRAIDDEGDSDTSDSDINIVATKLVEICGNQYIAYIDFEVIDDGTDRKYRPFVVGIPEEEIDYIEWSVVEDDQGYSDLDFGDSDLRDAADVDTVCVSAVVYFLCTGCEPFTVATACYEFNGTLSICDDLGLEMELEDGCWKPVRTGTITCCVALDLILWKIKEEDPWSVLREPIETICGFTVWFKRVVVFTNGCPNIAIEINSDDQS